MFAAMHPSGVAAPHSAHGQPSQRPKVVAASLHGGFFHSQPSSSLIHTSTSAARVMQRKSSACTALSAHSSLLIESSLRFVRR